MKTSLNLKTNILIILMSIFYFFILINIILFFSFEINLSMLFTFFIFYNIVFIILRYIVLIRNFFSVFLKENNNKDKKFIFYGNIFSLLIYLYVIITRLNLLPVLNILFIYPELIVTTIFNIPILYSIPSKIINNKYCISIIKTILLILFLFNIYLIFNNKYISEIILLP